MNEISIGLIYLPVSYEKSSLKGLYDKIAKETKFNVKEFIEDHYIILLSTKKNIKIIVDADGIVYYIKRIKEESFTSRQIYNIAKEGFDFIQKFPLNKEYLKRLGLVISGKGIQKFYAEKEEVIKEVGMKLFKKPSFSELEKTDFDVQLSIVSEEVPLLSFASND
jgi:hypothetical protein